MQEECHLNTAGFYIADSSFYERYQYENEKLNSGKFPLLKEWEILEKSGTATVNLKKLEAYEKQLGDPVLWNALLADRRIFFGEKASLEQDYASRFSHERMLAILQVGLEEMEALFDRVQPDVVIGFICVTIGEYLAYIVARSRGIPFLNLRPTRIKNYFHAGESVCEPSARVKASYHQINESGVVESVAKQIEEYLNSVRETHAMYEGVLPPPGAPRLGSAVKVAKESLFSKLGRWITDYRNYHFGKYRHDNHFRGVFYPLWYDKLKKPWRIWRTDSRLDNHYLHLADLEKLTYAFYPLHKEPEVTLLVYGRHSINQIEAIRNIAMSLPVGMKLVVKEHPAGLGYHPYSFYQKILSIPNVLLASPKLTSRDLLSRSRLVTLISGSIGLEAAMVGKPIICLGHVPYAFLPRTMLRTVSDLSRLSTEVTDLLATHEHDEKALISYVSAVMETSVPVDFYSVLLGRRGVYRPQQPSASESESNSYQDQIIRLALYLSASAQEAGVAGEGVLEKRFAND